MDTETITNELNEVLKKYGLTITNMETELTNVRLFDQKTLSLVETNLELTSIKLFAKRPCDIENDEDFA